MYMLTLHHPNISPISSACRCDALTLKSGIDASSPAHAVREAKSVLREALAAYAAQQVFT